ncbi:MAG: hypothetical protein HYS04_17200 [Acidobacteria bacterium]|nr:hypothetical protein [Acidobacteriota bacterium]
MKQARTTFVGAYNATDEKSVSRHLSLVRVEFVFCDHLSSSSSTALTATAIRFVLRCFMRVTLTKPA